MFKAAQRQQLKDPAAAGELICCYQPSNSSAAMPATWKSLGLALTSASLVMGGQGLFKLPK